MHAASSSRPRSNVSEKIKNAFLEAQKAIKAGNASAVEKARNTVQSQLFANYVQVRAHARIPGSSPAQGVRAFLSWPHARRQQGTWARGQERPKAPGSAGPHP